MGLGPVNNSTDMATAQCVDRGRGVKALTSTRLMISRLLMGT